VAEHYTGLSCSQCFFAAWLAEQIKFSVRRLFSSEIKFFLIDQCSVIDTIYDASERYYVCGFAWGLSGYYSFSFISMKKIKPDRLRKILQNSSLSFK